MVGTLNIRRLACTVWGAWMALLATLAGMLFLRIWHPHFLPATLLFVGFLASGILLVCRAAWFMAVGPERKRCLAWLLIGMAPLCFMAGHFAYGLQAFYRLDVPLNYALKVLVPLGESFMDLEARVRYPQRTRGAKVVMISRPVEDAARQVAAMDEHVRQIEERLGRQLDRPVHWVRGPLFGRQGLAVVGLCMGSRPNEAAVDAGGLDPLDRHEVAHCAIHMLCPPSCDPPTLLVEGWAEAHSGHDAVWLADRTWEYCQEGDVPPISELVSPAWSGRRDHLVYVQGGPLVNYLLQTYGRDKFFELYTACSRSTFAEDCRRILGVDISAIEAGYWAEVERLVHQEGPPERRRLAGIALDPGIDRTEWLALLDAYFASLPRRQAGKEDCRQSIDFEHTWTDTEGKNRQEIVRQYWKRSGLCCSFLIERGQEHEAYSAHPEHAFKATRKSTDEPWRIHRPAGMGPEQAYRLILRQILGQFDLPGLGDVSSLCRDNENRADWSSIVLARREPFQEAEKGLLRLRFENRTTQRQPLYRAMTLVLSVDESYAIRSCDLETPTPNDHAVHMDFEYDLLDGGPVLRVWTIKRHRPGGGPTTWTSVGRVVQRVYGAMPPEEFAAERLLGSHVVEGNPTVAFDEAPPRIHWSRWLLIAGVASLLAGVACLRIEPAYCVAQQSASPERPA